MEVLHLLGFAAVQRHAFAVLAQPHQREAVVRLEALLVEVQPDQRPADPLSVGGWLADSADGAVTAAMAIAARQLGLPPDFPLVALAMGKHGSREMGLVSDLDRVFVLASADPDAIGPKGKSQREWGQRRGRRIIQHLSMAPPFGAGFAFDARLRPSGSSGVLVTTIKGFTDCQMHEAETWEHQALCRARAVAGPDPARRAVMDVVARVLAMPRDSVKLAADVLAMRSRMLEHLGSHDADTINLKHDAGGLVDIEFLAQYARLAFGGQATGMMAMLQHLPETAPGPWREQAGFLAGAFADYRQMENVLRVQLWASVGRLPADDAAPAWETLRRHAPIKDVAALRLRMATVADVRPLFEREPCSLIFGAWDSHRKGRWPKFARLYSSSMYGLDPVVGTRKGGRMDSVNLTGTVDETAKAESDWKFIAEGTKQKGNKLSEIGHGNIAPNPVPGGVTVSEIRRVASISLAGLERLRFGDATADAGRFARAALATLALLTMGLTGGSVRAAPVTFDLVPGAATASGPPYPIDNVEFDMHGDRLIGTPIGTLLFHVDGASSATDPAFPLTISTSLSRGGVVSFGLQAPPDPDFPTDITIDPCWDVNPLAGSTPSPVAFSVRPDRATVLRIAASREPRYRADGRTAQSVMTEGGITAGLNYAIRQ